MSKKTWILLAVGAVLLIGATPALAQSGAPGPVSGWAAGLCNGVGSMASTIGDVLGLSTEELAEARQDGKSLAEIAEEQGVGGDELVDAMLAAREEALAQAVEDGRITQEEATSMLERMRDRMEQRTTDEGFGPRGGGFGGCGGTGAGGSGGGAGGGCGGGPVGGAATTSL